VVAPIGGYLPAKVLRRLDVESTVLLRDRALPSATRPLLSTQQGARVVLSDSAAGTGGPDPGSRFSALSVRQRVLSEAALHALSPDRGQPLVVSAPERWDPGAGWDKADFFGGLGVDWLTLVDLPSVARAGRAVPAPPPVVYPRTQAAHEVPYANLLATKQLINTGDTFARVLTRNSTVDEQLARTALLGSGSTARREPLAALNRVRGTTTRIRELMGQVRVDGPPFVTMSSEQGPIQITVVNGLDQEVTVEVHALTESRDLDIASSDQLTLGPGRRTSVRLTARARDIGVHPVTLELTDTTGDPLGSTAHFNVRTSQVGLVIWLIMGAGGAVLFVAVATRIVRRIRGYRARRRPRVERAA
jgi:hypothetical protein